MTRLVLCSGTFSSVYLGVTEEGEHKFSALFELASRVPADSQRGPEGLLVGCIHTFTRVCCQEQEAASYSDALR